MRCVVSFSSAALSFCGRQFVQFFSMCCFISSMWIMGFNISCHRVKETQGGPQGFFNKSSLVLLCGTLPLAPKYSWSWNHHNAGALVQLEL